MRGGVSRALSWAMFCLPKRVPCRHTVRQEGSGCQVPGARCQVLCAMLCAGRCAVQCVMQCCAECCAVGCAMLCQ